MNNVSPLFPDSGGNFQRYGNFRPNGDNDALISTSAPRIPWPVFIERLTWNQGEHVGLIGPTGQGKTTLLTSLLDQRTYVALFATKPRDPSMDYLISQGYMKLERWENYAPRKFPKRVIWPNATDIESEDLQKHVFDNAFKSIYRETGWCIVLDEGYYVSKVLQLGNRMRTIWTQGRSLGISFVVATQRPRWVPLEMYDQSTHLFFWRENDDDNLSRIGGMGAAPSRLVREIVANLDVYQTLYVNTRTGEMMRTKAPAPRYNIGGES